MASDLEVLETIALARPGASGPGLVYLRDLAESDVSALRSGAGPGLPANPLARLKHTHHLLARLIAEGRKQVEISLITGYSPSRISVLKDDPAFKELVSYYAEQAEAIYANVHERRAQLGLSAIEELQERVDTDPQSFSNRELMELVETTLDSPAKTAAGPGALGPGGLNINIAFVKAEDKPRRDDQRDGSGNSKIIDITPG